MSINNEKKESYIWLYNIENDTFSQITFQQAFYPTWAQGSKIVYYAKRDSISGTYCKSIEGGNDEKILLQNSQAYPGSCSPDGKFLAFYMNKPNTNRDIGILSLKDNTVQTVADRQ